MQSKKWKSTPILRSQTLIIKKTTARLAPAPQNFSSKPKIHPPPSQRRLHQRRPHLHRARQCGRRRNANATIERINAAQSRRARATNKLTLRRWALVVNRTTCMQTNANANVIIRLVALAQSRRRRWYEKTNSAVVVAAAVAVHRTTRNRIRTRWKTMCTIMRFSKKSSTVSPPKP